MLHHKLQRLSYGCLYHALFAITGDEAWLEHVDDVSQPRWHARLHAAGLMVMTYWSSELIEQPCPAEFWTVLRERFAALPGVPTHISLLVTVKGLNVGHHIVAVALPVSEDHPAIISDSAKNSLWEMPLADFLLSPWAEAYAVESIAPAEVDAYPEDPGHLYFTEPAGDYAM
ncbi:hypothetical protein ACFP81_10625 [Deinococcus lacus]|uniref:Uncharacterized protein n=1 Tax=Deinococcus lacus TaxID=392561 RepID=A0ABW1YDI3_9DEIO